MTEQIISYSALTIGKKHGATHWGQAKETLCELRNHIRRYNHRECDILIYAHYSSESGIPSECVEQHWNVKPNQDFTNHTQENDDEHRNT